MLQSTCSGTKLDLSFDAVFYYVTDIEKSIAFYRDGLGLPLVSRDYVARFEFDGVLFELVPLPPGAVVYGNGNARLCFAVRDLQETLDELHARGIITGDITSKKGGKIAFFQDPDGNELSLWQYENIERARDLIHSAELHRQG